MSNLIRQMITHRSCRRKQIQNLSIFAFKSSSIGNWLFNSPKTIIISLDDPHFRWREFSGGGDTRISRQAKIRTKNKWRIRCFGALSLASFIIRHIGDKGTSRWTTTTWTNNHQLNRYRAAGRELLIRGEFFQIPKSLATIRSPSNNMCRPSVFHLR